MKKILITGADGQVGRSLFQILNIDINEILCPSILSCDITSKTAVFATILGFAPDVIFHCAAYTAVDKAEDDEEACRDVNVNGTRNVAEGAAKAGAKLIYLSSDYVFDGTLDGTYEVNSMTNPLSVYGRSKLDGEIAVRECTDKHFIVRTSWLFGDGGNFVRTMLRIGKERDYVTVVSDQIGSPTYTADLAKLLVNMSETEKYGTYHATNEGYCSWSGFTEAIFKEANYSTMVTLTKTAEYGVKASRPLNSKLSKRKLTDNGFELLPTWHNALRRYIANDLR